MRRPPLAGVLGFMHKRAERKPRDSAAALRRLCLGWRDNSVRASACEGPSTPAGDGRVTRDPAKVSFKPMQGAGQRAHYQ